MITKRDDAALWQAYKKSRSVKNRNALVEFHLPLAKHISCKLWHRFSHYSWTQDDFLSWGVFGLIHAIENFDPDQGPVFSTYAYKCIYCQMLTGIELVTKGSRNNTRKGQMNAKMKITTKLDYVPSPDLIAQYDDEEELDYYLDFLTDLERTVITRHYLQGIRQQDIGVEVSRSRQAVNGHAIRGMRKMQRVAEKIEALNRS